MCAARRVAVITLGCARNELDSEELAARLSNEGWRIVDDAARADAVVVNTCAFVETAKRESVDTLLAAAGLKSDKNGPRAVIAAGCLAERYGAELAAALPEADAVVGFDQYADIAARLTDVLEGRPVAAHQPGDRRRLLPIAPTQRQPVAVGIPGHSGGPQPLRRRLTTGPVAAVKLASGCDRRCSFCAIPSFRGAFVSRLPDDVIAEVEWLAGQGVREVVLVSENSTSYGKDLGDVRLLERLLPQLAAVEGIARVRLTYLQPAEMRPSLVTAVATTPGVAASFDLSFQHASGDVLRRMRRFGDGRRFLDLLHSIREQAPDAGVRSNFIVGFPGETRTDVTALVNFLEHARLDGIGVFDYSDEDGTEAAGFDGKVAARTVQRRGSKVRDLADELVAQRAAERVGSVVDVLIEEVRGALAEGRADHQGPDDTSTVIRGAHGLRVGDVVRVRVDTAHGADLVGSLVTALAG